MSYEFKKGDIVSLTDEYLRADRTYYDNGVMRQLRHQINSGKEENKFKVTDTGRNAGKPAYALNHPLIGTWYYEASHVKAYKSLELEAEEL